jgi:hypothetical protein
VPGGLFSWRAPHDVNSLALCVLWQAAHAVAQQTFRACPDFSLRRMTWIKPGFLWMMHRSGWATKPNQVGARGRKASQWV